MNAGKTMQRKTIIWTTTAFLVFVFLTMPMAAWAFLPNKCVFTGQFECVDYRDAITRDNQMIIDIMLRSHDENISLERLTMSDCEQQAIDNRTVIFRCAIVEEDIYFRGQYFPGSSIFIPEDGCTACFGMKKSFVMYESGTEVGRGDLAIHFLTENSVRQFPSLHKQVAIAKFTRTWLLPLLLVALLAGIIIRKYAKKH
jgi:hypothetical protein